MLSALGQCGRDSGVALGLPECPGLVVWGPILKGEKKKNLWRLQETTAQPLAVCTLNAFAVRTGAACIAPGPGLFELDLWPC